MKTNFYQLDYTKQNGQNTQIVVKARNENEAIPNAKNVCYTGKDFRNPEQVPEQATFADTTSGHHSNRANR